MKPLAACRLYTFIDTAYLRGRAPELVAKQLCDGGSDLIQLRAKNSPLDEIRKMAEAILPIVRAANVGLVINDHLSIAAELGADFCHLGQEDFFAAGYTNVSQLPSPGPTATELRKPAEAVTPSSPSPLPKGRGLGRGVRSLPLLDSTAASSGPRLQIGLSTHAPDQARRALAAGPGYIAIGPVYATGTKPAAKPVTLEYVRWAATNVDIPWFAIGGINLENLDEVLAAGATRICVVSAILNAPDIAKACQGFKKRLQ